jgi:hypothetical protein
VPNPSAPKFKPGDRVTWRRKNHRGGAEELILAQVVSLTQERVVIKVRLRGHLVKRAVLPGRLQRRNP